MRLSIRILLLSIIFMAPLHSFGAENLTIKLVQPVLTDDKEGMMKIPQGVACNNDGLFIVADTGNDRLLTFTYKDEVVKSGAEIKLPQLAYPIRLQLNSKGEIFVLDEKLRRIARLNPQGGFVGFVDPQGLPAPAGFVPRSFKIDAHDNIYLLDILSERVLVLDPGGKFLKQIPFPAQHGSISDLAVNANGDIYLIDSSNAMVFVAPKDSVAFTPLTKSLREDMNYPAYITTDKRGYIFVVDQNGGGIIVLGQNGTFLTRLLQRGWKPGFLNYPSQICIDDKGNVFVADRDNSRLQIFEPLR
jgi:streptogramin lyase